jgi:sugar/nucleoside kinase (ribokinase family)
MSCRVLGLGAVAMDIVLECDHLPPEDGYAIIDTEIALPGGSCANVITALAGLGTRSGFIACLGDDAIGHALRPCLRGREVHAAGSSAEGLRGGHSRLHGSIRRKCEK